ncbi:MAG: HAMP domain-containing protein [Verrucomicrobiae bacterium]|nr:HAMP domain-containing protein [Verrucomicrobiae bacterium]
MFTKSIRWRLQLWFAFLLICTLSGFGIATFEVYRTRQLRQVDERLAPRVEGLARVMRGPQFIRGGRPPFESGRDRRGGGPPGSFDGFPPYTPDERRPPFVPPWEATNSAGGIGLPLPPDLERLLGEDQQGATYFLVWNAEGTRLHASTNAPTDLSRPPATTPDSGPHFRTRDGHREAYDYNREGRAVLVGKSIAAEREALRGFALMLVGAGLSVLALGLGGGWFIASRALRPLQDISATASRISGGNLAERISVADTENELGQLAGVLNSTFARLESAFAQQKQFTADASHELRTPIAVLLSEAQTTLARPRSAEEYRETLEACLETAQQMRRLTESLLELARFDAGQEKLRHEPVDLAEIVRASAELVRPLAAEKGVQVHCDLAPGRVLGDEVRLGQVVTNLLTNAIRYNQVAGEVRVRTVPSATNVVLTVADNGPGVAAEDLPHIFERFYRADKSRTAARGRTGLGLAICKAIVDAHGGDIEVQSAPDAGSSFIVRLPQAAG